MVKGKYIAGIVLILLGIGIYYTGKTGFGHEYTGLGVLLQLFLGIVGAIVAVWTILLAALIMAVDEAKTPWVLGFWLFSTILIVSLVIPGPLPFWILEVISGLGTALFGIKVIGTEKVKEKLPMF